MTGLEVADVVLGIKIIRDGNQIMFGESHYIEKVLKRFNMLDKTPISNPMKPSMKHYKHT